MAQNVEIHQKLLEAQNELGTQSDSAKVFYLIWLASFFSRCVCCRLCKTALRIRCDRLAQRSIYDADSIWFHTAQVLHLQSEVQSAAAQSLSSSLMSPPNLDALVHSQGAPNSGGAAAVSWYLTYQLRNYPTRCEQESRAVMQIVRHTTSYVCHVVIQLCDQLADAQENANRGAIASMEV